MYQYGVFEMKDFKRLSHFIHSHFGINLPENKLPLVQSRLHKRIYTLELNSYKEYCDYVLSSKGQQHEVIPLMDVISTNKTDFFREDAHFEFLKNNLFCSDAFKEKHIRIWSAGSSSGEEAYTLSMVMMDLMEQGKIKDFNIIGTDISTQVLKIATKAVYPFIASQDIPEQYRKKYLLKSKDGKFIRMDKQLRSRVQFSRLNLMDSPFPFQSNFDIVFCRNTLIYFTKTTQEEVVTKLIHHLHTNGHIFIGHSESLLNMNLNVERVKPTIHKKNNDVRHTKKEEFK